jgi:hypothetical protein
MTLAVLGYYKKIYNLLIVFIISLQHLKFLDISNSIHKKSLNLISGGYRSWRRGILEHFGNPKAFQSI